MPVQIIEAIPRNSTAPDAPKKLRCAYYARISLDEDGTNTSIAGQKAYFEDYIKNNPLYVASGAYYDDGISGTSTRKRHGFNQMLRDVEDNKLDVILVKSISRWGRNIVLTLSSLRLCAEHNCRVYFFKEALWSDDPATNLILTIMSSMAEAESSSISQNVAMGIRYSFQQGKPMINCSYFLGYDKDPVTKKLIINPSQAATVRFIYRAYLEGFSIPEIAKKLRAWGVPSGGGKSTWPVESIKYILSNEKYVGDLLMQKTWVPSFLTHKVVKNDGRLPQYFVADNHDAIVPREVWDLTQALLLRHEGSGRGSAGGGGSGGKTCSHPGQRKYVLSGKVFCGRCGTEYKRFAGGRKGDATTAGNRLGAGVAAGRPGNTEPGQPGNTDARTLGTTPLSVDNDCMQVYNGGTMNTRGRVAVSAGASGGAGTGARKSTGTGNAATVITSGPFAGVVLEASNTDSVPIAVWKCMARCNVKEAEKARRHLSAGDYVAGNYVAGADATSLARDSGAADEATSPATDRGAVANTPSGGADDSHTAGQDDTVSQQPADHRSRRKLGWRCDNDIIEEPVLLDAVERAIGLLPREEENIKAIQRECVAIIARHEGNENGGDGHTESENIITAAQLLLLHCDTALRYIKSTVSGCEGAPSYAGQTSDGEPGGGVATFIAHSSVTEYGSLDPVELLVDRVIVDGKRIRVRFKAGVEI